MKNVIRMNVWIHSHAETGEPCCVSVYDIDGRMNMDWFEYAFSEENEFDLAHEFYEKLGAVDDIAWFDVEMLTESVGGHSEHYADVIGLSENQT